MNRVKLLLTAFEPFDGEQINPAWEAVKQLPEQIGRIAIEKLLVPTVFGASLTLVSKKIKECRPEVVICVGQAGGRAGISLERVAINCSDARIPDNEGNKPEDCPIAPEGPAAYFSTLPIKAMVEAMKAAGVPASVSNTAGTFVCNQLMYGVLHTIATEDMDAKAGFIHVPYIPVQAAGKPEPVACMALSDIVRGLEAGIGTLG